MTSTQMAGVIAWNQGVSRVVTEQLATEEPLEIRVRGRAISITMRTPGNDDEMAIGFLFTEGIIRSRSDVLKVEPCTRVSDDGSENNVLNVLLAPEVAVDFGRLTRHLFASSSCGICGKASIAAIRGHFPSIDSTVTLTIPTLLSLPNQMRMAQREFDATGAIHAAALFKANGSPIVVREDVGRHNAVDKAIGFALTRGQQGDVLMVSGRTSFEILQKALAAKVPIVAAVSAPSSLAVEFAREMGITLIGFLRENRMNVYSCPKRVTGVSN